MSNTEYKAAQVKKEYPQFITTIVEDRVLVEYSITESMHFKNDVPLGMVLSTIAQEIEKAAEDDRELYELLTPVTMHLTRDQIEALKYHLTHCVKQSEAHIKSLKNGCTKWVGDPRKKRVIKCTRMVDAVQQVLTAVREA